MSKEISFEEQTPVKGWDIPSLERYIRQINHKITYLVENTNTHPWPLDEALDYEQLQYNLQEANKELKNLQNIVELADPSENTHINIYFTDTPTPNSQKSNSSNNNNNNNDYVEKRRSDSRLERKKQVEEKRRLTLEKQILSEKEEEKRILQQLEEMRSLRVKADNEKEQRYVQEISQYKQREEKLLHEIKKLQLQVNSLQFRARNEYEEYLNNDNSPNENSNSKFVPPPKNFLKDVHKSPDRTDDSLNKRRESKNITKLQGELQKKNLNLAGLQPQIATNAPIAVKPVQTRQRSNSNVNNDAIEEIKEWEKKKQRFTLEMENIVKQTELKLEYLCTDYFVSYENEIISLCQDKKLLFDFRKFIDQEKQRVDTQIANLFSCEKYHSSISSIVNHISVIQQGLSGVDNSLILAQAIARGYITRKKWLPIFKTMKQRTRCAQEIFDTEKAYNQKLLSLIKAFKIRMEKELPPVSSNIVLDKFLPSVTRKDVDTIFSTIPLIINTSDQLLKSLENRMKDWNNSQSVGDIFLEFAPYFKSYIQYVNNYDNSMAILERGMKIPSFVSLLKKCKNDADGGLDIGSFLIMPIQRVPRYALLLKELHRFTPTFHKDYQNLTRAVDEISKVAKLINENKREEENKRKVRSIAELFGNKCENLVQPQRRFVHQGEVIVNAHNFCTMEKEMREEPYECYLFLFNDILLLGKKPKSSIANTLNIMVRVGAEMRSIYNFKEQIYVDGMVVGEWTDEEMTLPSFYIKYKNRLPDHFYTQSIADRDEWVSILKQTIQNYEVRKSTLKLSETFDPWEIKVAEEGSGTQNNSSNVLSQVNNQFSVGNVNMNSNIYSTRIQTIEYSTLRELLPLYSEAMWLLKELFTVPIELQTFIPEYCQKFPPGYLSEINNRLQLIKRRLNDLNIVRDKIIPLIKNEKMVCELNEAMLYGKVPLHSAFVWIQQNYPPDSVDTKPRELLKDLLQWYNHLSKLWNKVMDTPLDK